MSIDVYNYQKPQRQLQKYPEPKRTRRPSIAIIHRDEYIEDMVSIAYWRLWLLLGVIVVASMMGGCATQRGLPVFYMPEPPKECKQISEFKVDPFPKGKTTDAQVSVWLAKEGAERQKEHEISKVCADYALGSAEVMKDKDKPDNTKTAELKQKARQPAKERKDKSEPMPQPLANPAQEEKPGNGT